MNCSLCSTMAFSQSLNPLYFLKNWPILKFLIICKTLSSETYSFSTCFIVGVSIGYLRHGCPAKYTKQKKKRNQSKLGQFNGMCFTFFAWYNIFRWSHTIGLQKSFKWNHFLFTFGLVYHIAYFTQNTSLSCSQDNLESSILKFT